MWKNIWSVTKQVFSEWSEDNAPRLAAALAYYTIFSLAPMLVIAIAVAGFIFGREAAQGEVISQIRDLVGTRGAEAVEMLLVNANRHGAGVLATIIGVILLLVGATGVFTELQQSLNVIWEVQQRPGIGIWWTIRQRFLSFAMVLGIGFLLMVSLVISAALAALGRYIGGFMPSFILISRGIELFISFGAITLLFAMVFKVLPDVKIAWRDVWLGAAITSLLFAIGKYLLGLYLGRGSVAGVYGAAGSLVVLILWVYYSAQILFLGAEFTQVHARRAGRHLAPDRDAIPLDPYAAAQQGFTAHATHPAQPAQPAATPAPSRIVIRPRRSIASILSLVAAFVLGRLLPPHRR